jgi:hypothetical protein
MKFIYNVLNFKLTARRCIKLNANNRKSLFLSILMIFSLLSISTNAQSWLAGYDYRRALTINNSGSSVTDYQVRIQLNNSNFNNHFPQVNGEDIRVTSDDGTTLLPIWIESWSSNQGTIWTKIPSVPAGTSTIYIYYGNNSATSVSNGDNTFDFFEDNWVINPVIRSSQPSWEVSITYPMFFKEPDSTHYTMIYDGHGFNESKGLATSSDLINWTPYASNPIFGYDAGNVWHGPLGAEGQYAWGDITKVGPTYHLFPSQGPGQTVHATSTDLINWTGFSATGLTGIGSGAAILKEGDGITPVMNGGYYWMVYTQGTNPDAIHLAHSSDLMTWSPDGIILDHGSDSDWDSTMFSPSFIKENNTYYIFYQGYKHDSNWQIGFASAPATTIPLFASWTKYASNPVLSGNHGWDNPVAIDPEFRKFGDTYYIFYTGGGGSNGFATSSNPEGPYTQNTNNNNWVKGPGVTGKIPTVSGGTISFGLNQSLQTKLSYSADIAVGFRGQFHNDTLGYKFAGFIDRESAPFLIYQVDPGFSDLHFMARHCIGCDPLVIEPLTKAPLIGYHNFEITWTHFFTGYRGQAIIDGIITQEILGNPGGIPDGPLPVNFENLSNSTSTFDVDWMYLRKSTSFGPTITTVGAEQFGGGITINAKVFLEGPYSGGGTMTTSLNINNLIPLNSNTAYSTTTYGYTESVVSSIPNSNIVDWVLIELRTGTGSGTKVATRAAFLKNDGTIVDSVGSSPVAFAGVSAGNYYIVVRHRNHLAIMSANSVALSGSSLFYNFTTGQSQAYTSGTDPMVALTGGGYGMIAGDANTSAIITAADISPIIANLNTSVYIGADVNMSAIVTAADITKIISNLNKATNVPN